MYNYNVATFTSLIVVEAKIADLTVRHFAKTIYFSHLTQEYRFYTPPSAHK